MRPSIASVSDAFTWFGIIETFAHAWNDRSTRRNCVRVWSFRNPESFDNSAFFGIQKNSMIPDQMEIGKIRLDRKPKTMNRYLRISNGKWNILESVNQQLTWFWVCNSSWSDLPTDGSTVIRDSISVVDAWRAIFCTDLKFSHWLHSRMSHWLICLWEYLIAFWMKSMTDSCSQWLIVNR